MLVYYLVLWIGFRTDFIALFIALFNEILWTIFKKCLLPVKLVISAAVSLKIGHTQ